jgi:hypothetical protein
MDFLVELRADRAKGVNRPDALSVYWHDKCSGYHLSSKIQKTWMNNAPDIRKEFFECGRDLRTEMENETEMKNETEELRAV